MISVRAAVLPPLASPLPLLFVPEDPGSATFLVQANDFSARLGAGSLELSSRGARVGMVFPGAATVAPEGIEPLGARVSRIFGSDPSQWRVGLPAYRGVVYRSLYARIDFRVVAEGGTWKSEFVVAPGGDPREIAVRYEGAGQVGILRDGSLSVSSADGEWREHPPVLYQDGPGGRRTVEGRYRLVDARTVGFETGAYDPALPLVVDPTLTYSGVLGGGGISTCTSGAADAGGNIYLAGYTDASDFPTASPASRRGGGVDAVVAKLNPATGQLVYAAYIGGSMDDRAMRIAVDETGAAYVTGTTASPDFPIVAGAQRSLRGYRDAFLLKLSPAGDRIEFSTFFGGLGVESGRAIVAGHDGVWIAGESDSTDLPAGSGFQPFLRGRSDGFIARFSLTGEYLASSYLGGAGDDSPRALALHPSGALVVAGATDSGDFPAIGALAGASGAGQDAFLAMVTPGLDAISFSSRIGGGLGDGSQQEVAEAVAVDAAGAVYLGGSTPSADFPTKSALQASFGGLLDGFLMKIDMTSREIVWSTFYGGWDRDSVSGIAVDGYGRVHAAGSTISANLPQLAGVQTDYRGNRDAFLLRLEAGGNSFSFASYLGGSGADAVVAMGVTALGRMWVAGQTSSPDFPLLRSAQTLTSTSLKFFATQLLWAAQPEPVSVSPSSGSAPAQTFEVRFRHDDGAASLKTMRFRVGTASTGAGACAVEFDRTSTTLRLAADNGSSGAAVHPGALEDARNSQCTLSGYAARVVETGSEIALRLPLTFSLAFGGAKQLYGEASDVSGQDSGARLLGSFTVVVPNQPPQTLAVAPAAASGAGAGQVFTFTFTDPDGTPDFRGAYLLLNRVTDARYGCFVYFEASSGLLYLADDSVSGFIPVHPGTAESAQNSQCVLWAAGSSAALSGTTLTVSASLTLKASLNGVVRIFGDAEDIHGGSSGFRDLGTYTLSASNSVPTLESVTPAAGVGTGTVFAVTAGDDAGAGQLLGVHVIIIRPGGSAGTGCYLVHYRNNGLVWLADDGGATWSTVRIGTADIAQNSYCQIAGTGISVSETATTLTLRVPVTFKAAMTGLNQIFAMAVDVNGFASGFLNKGTYTVGATINRPPEAVSISPANTAIDGAPATYTLTYRDPDGAADLRGAYADWNWYPDGHYACFVYYNAAANMLYLADDDGTVFQPIHMGTTEAIQNGQCVLYAEGSSAKFAGTDLTLALRIALKESLNGTLRIYSAAEDSHGVLSGFRDLGYHLLNAANHTPRLAAVTPDAGTGTGAEFQFTASDADGINDLNAIQMLISKPGMGGDAGCFLTYYRNSGKIWLQGDGSTGWLSARLGTSDLLRNSYCAVSVQGIVVVEDATSFTLRVPLQFQSTMTGLNLILGHALDIRGITSGFGFKGTYTVGAPVNRPPGLTAVTPAQSAGNGIRQVFQFTYQDPDGVADVTHADAILNSIPTSLNACSIYYERAANVFRLGSDSLTGYTVVHPGAYETAENTHCTLYGADSSVSVNGDSITLTVAVTLRWPLNTRIRLYGSAQDKQGTSNGYSRSGYYSLIPN